MLTVKIQKVTDAAIIPSYAHPGDAGVDLYAAEDAVLMPGERKLVRTGIKIAVTKCYEA